jgi:hypothetical protein
MKIEADELDHFVLKEIYETLPMETEEGNRLYVCMRDNTFELYIEPKGQVGVRYRVNMEKRMIEKL